MADNPDNKRRDFLQLSTISIGAVGTAAFIWPFLKSMSPYRVGGRANTEAGGWAAGRRI